MTTEEKQTAGMDDMFAHGNEPLPTSVENPLEPIKVESDPATPDRQRDEQGRFASSEATKPAEVAPPAAPQPVIPAADPEKQPLTKAEFKGMMDEREKRQRAEKEAADLRVRVQQFESQQQQTQVPSVNDPAYADYLAQQVQSARISERFDTSEILATEKHGEQPVKVAMEWAMERSRTSPAFAAEYLKQKHPIDWAVKQHKRDALVSNIGDDEEAYIRRRAAELGIAAAPQPQAAQPATAASPQSAPETVPQAQAPSRSIANATSAGGLQVVPPQGEFAALDLAHKH